VTSKPNAPVETIPFVSISIVSHGQGNLVAEALGDLARMADAVRIEVILTKNVPEALPFSTSDFSYPLTIVGNEVPKGFGANHNAAFKLAQGEWFCVMNPDIRLTEDPFMVLLAEMARRPAAVIGPAVLTPSGQIEDSIRHFPSILSLADKMLSRDDGRYPFALGDETFEADWVAGMFMLFRAEDYRAVGGFDEGFFLYYEDVDICARLWKAGARVLACPKAQVIHDARRTSRRDFRYLRWHVSSMARYFWKHWGRLPKGSFS
jgi:N-acetylglucosaminyl-diphospho-decaprenol L-rhamnosyltransferase